MFGLLVLNRNHIQYSLYSLFTTLVCICTTCKHLYYYQCVLGNLVFTMHNCHGEKDHWLFRAVKNICIIIKFHWKQQCLCLYDAAHSKDVEHFNWKVIFKINPIHIIFTTNIIYYSVYKTSMNIKMQFQLYHGPYFIWPTNTFFFSCDRQIFKSSLMKSWSQRISSIYRYNCNNFFYFFVYSLTSALSFYYRLKVSVGRCRQ